MLGLYADESDPDPDNDDVNVTVADLDRGRSCVRARRAQSSRECRWRTEEKCDSSIRSAIDRVGMQAAKPARCKRVVPMDFGGSSPSLRTARLFTTRREFSSGGMPGSKPGGGWFDPSTARYSGWQGMRFRTSRDRRGVICCLANPLAHARGSLQGESLTSGPPRSVAQQLHDLQVGTGQGISFELV